jgi:hypothetical protein
MGVRASASSRFRHYDRRCAAYSAISGISDISGREDFLYVFKPGRHGPDAPPLASASARSRSAPRARRAAGARHGPSIVDVLNPQSDNPKQTLAARQVSGIARTEQGCRRHVVTVLSRRPPQGLPRHVKGASSRANRASAGRRPLDVAWLGYARSTGEHDGFAFKDDDVHTTTRTQIRTRPTLTLGNTT